MFCPSCGAENNTDNNFCAECGTVLPRSKGHVAATIAPPTPAPQNRPSDQLSASMSGVGAAQSVDPAISIQHALTSGTLFAGRYEIHGVLGKGGMGIVYRARDNELGETIAIKVLQAQFTADPADVERFKREIITARRITHPNVIRIHDFGVSGDEAFISMELLEGGTLAGKIQRGELDLDAAVRISTEIASGLAAAHDQGVIHRDIKPHNVLFDDKGRAKLLDFGIARLSAATSHTVGFTGTPHYMSPEQAEGRQVSFKSDLYSLGVLMYEMFSGELPFQADSLVRLAVMHAQEPPPPLASKRPGIPAELEAIVMHALEKNDSYRYQSASEIAEDLKAYEHGRSLVHAVVGQPQRSPGIAGAASVDATSAASLAPGTIPPKTAAPQPPPQKGSALKWVIAAGVVVVLGGGALAAYQVLGKNRGEHGSGSGTMLAMKDQPRSAGENRQAASAIPLEETEEGLETKPSGGGRETHPKGGFHRRSHIVKAEKTPPAKGKPTATAVANAQGTPTPENHATATRGGTDTALGSAATPAPTGTFTPAPAGKATPSPTATPKRGFIDRISKKADDLMNPTIEVPDGQGGTSKGGPKAGATPSPSGTQLAGIPATKFTFRVVDRPKKKYGAGAEAYFCGHKVTADAKGWVKAEFVLDRHALDWGCELQVKSKGQIIYRERIDPKPGEHMKRVVNVALP